MIFDFFQTPLSSKPQKRKFSHNDHKLANKKLRKKHDLGQQFQPNIDDISLLTPKIVACDMLLLGCVKDIEDYHLRISLPGGLEGTVAVTDISDTYTNQLERLTDNDHDVIQVRNS